MGISLLNDQFNLQASTPIDVRETPLADIDALSAYSYYGSAYDGLKITVNNSGNPITFVMASNGATSKKKYHWKVDSVLRTSTLGELNTMSSGIVASLSTSKTKSGAFQKGNMAIVLADETNGGAWSEYIADSITDGIPSWVQRHVDVRNFSLSADTDASAILILYNGVPVGSAATLTDILQDWQNDQYISSGSVVNEGGINYISLEYNDETIDPVMISLEGIGGKFEPLSAANYTEALTLATSENLTRAIFVEGNEVDTPLKITVSTNGEEFVLYRNEAGDREDLDGLNYNWRRPGDSFTYYSDTVDVAAGESIDLDETDGENGGIISARIITVTDPVYRTSGLYMVNGLNSIVKLGVTTVTGDFESELASLSSRVSTLESQPCVLYWETDEE